jgi:hypothetical protein
MMNATMLLSAVCDRRDVSIADIFQLYARHPEGNVLLKSADTILLDDF